MINKCHYNPTHIFACLQLVLTHRMTQYPRPKNWGMSKDIPQEIFPNFQTLHVHPIWKTLC